MLPSHHRKQLRALNVTWIIVVSAVTVTLFSGLIAPINGAPAKLDSNETPLPLELQPPLFADAGAAAANDDSDAADILNSKRAIDSYGNPIESLQPIDTPDGRKVVSAQGLQFEIPNYASGITEINKPANDLLPPFIDPISSGEADATQNTFLAARKTGAYNPQPQVIATTTAPTTTTTTTAAPLIENPFDTKVPDWLAYFDYPDVGPGVPFEYDPNEVKSAVSKDLQPPSNVAPLPDNTKPVFLTSSPASINNLQTPKPLAPTQLSATSLASTPSKVTIPLPSIQDPQSSATVPQPPLVFVPPAAEPDAVAAVPVANNNNNNYKNAHANTNHQLQNTKTSTSSSFTTHFAAPFEPATGLAASSETAPQAFVPTKFTFTKSDKGGKVKTDSNAFPATQQQQQPQSSANFGSRNSSNAPPKTKNPFLSNLGGNSASSSDTFKSSSSTGFNFSASSSFSKPAPPAASVVGGTITYANGGKQFVSRFGGPPGILTPYDNIKNGGRS